jgi:phosphoserine phosphatase
VVRLFAFDLEGTILTGQPCALPGAPEHHDVGMWPLLMKELGEKAVEADRDLALQWDAGHFRHYLDWCDASLDVMRRYGLQRNTFERLESSFSLNQGIEDLVNELHHREIITAIISGGFYEQARRVQADLKIRHCYASVDLTWGIDGRLVAWNLLPAGPDGKLGFLRLIADSYDIELADCAYVSDNADDVPIARNVGVSFAYGGNELAVASTHKIKDFSSVSGLLGS